MKRNWLLYLVIFSLALNLGTMGAFAYLRWQDRGEEGALRQSTSSREGRRKAGEAPLPFRELLGKLNLDAQQLQELKRLSPEHHRQVGALRQELAQKRGALFDLLKQGDLPAWEPVRAKVREINQLQLGLEEEMVRHLLEIQKLLKPEQRAVLLVHLEKRLSHFWRGRGQGWGPPGARRGHGRGPDAPCPPGSPEAK